MALGPNESALTEVRSEFSRILRGGAGARDLCERLSRSLIDLRNSEHQLGAFLKWLDTQLEETSGPQAGKLRNLRDLLLRCHTAQPVELEALAGLNGSHDLPSLFGMSMMRVSPRFNEIYYTDIVSDMLAPPTVDFIKRTVSIPGNRRAGSPGGIEWSGSVGQAVTHKRGERCVPNSFLDAPGLVACADLVGGNLSILMKAVEGARSSEDEPPSVTAVVFCFMPLRGFFRPDDAITSSFYAAVETRSIAVRRHLKLREVEARAMRLAILMREHTVDHRSAPEPEPLLLQALVASDTQDNDLGTIGGLFLRHDETESVVAAMSLCDRFLEQDAVFADWLTNRAEAEGLVAQDLLVTAEQRTFGELLLITASTAPGRLSRELSPTLSSIVADLWRYWQEAFVGVDAISPSVPSDEPPELSQAGGHAKVASDLVLALLDLAAASVANLLWSEEPADSLTQKQLELVLALWSAEVNRSVDAEAMATRILSEIRELSGALNPEAVALVARAAPAHQIDSNRQQSDAGGPASWKGAKWARLRSEKVNALLGNLLDFGSPSVKDAWDLSQSKQVVPATIMPFGNVETIALHCGKELGGRARGSFVLIGLPSVPSWQFSDAVDSSPVVSLVKSYYSTVLMERERASLKEQESVARYARGASHALKNALVVPLVLLRRHGQQGSGRKDSQNRLDMGSLAMRILEKPTLSKKDRDDLWSIAETVKSLSLQLGHLQEQATLFFWVMDRKRARTDIAALSQTASQPIAPVIVRALLRGLFATVVWRLTDLDLAPAMRTSGAAADEEIRALKASIVRELVSFDLGTRREFCDDAIVNVSLSFRQRAHLRLDVAPLPQRACHAETAIVAEAVLAELFQNAFKAAFLAAGGLLAEGLGKEPVVACRTEQEDDWTRIEVANTASPGDITRVVHSTQRSAMGITTVPWELGSGGMQGVWQIQSLCELLGPERLSLEKEPHEVDGSIIAAIRVANAF